MRTPRLRTYNLSPMTVGEISKVKAGLETEGYMAKRSDEELMALIPKAKLHFDQSKRDLHGPEAKTPHLEEFLIEYARILKQYREGKKEAAELLNLFDLLPSP